MSLRDEILARCTPEEIAARNFHVIAAKVSAGRVRVVQPKLVGKGTISAALGPVAGPVFIYTLKNAAAASLPAQPSEQQIAEKAMLDLAWELINVANFDVGLQATRDGLDAFVGKLPGFTQQAADAMKALAHVPAPVTWDECMAALDA